MKSEMLDGWIKANGPGGWIDDLRKERNTLKAQRDGLATVLTDLLRVVGVRIDDPRIKQFDAAREALSKLSPVKGAD